MTTTPEFDLFLRKKFQNAVFITSATRIEECPTPVSVELAVVGRSNVGKSSVINCLCQQKKLAKTSKTPGRTQLINFFKITDQLHIVDLPGYGYAKVPQAQQKHWEKELARFLLERDSLRGLILIVDVRHGLKEIDNLLISLADEAELPVHLVLNKADKLSRNQANKALGQLRRALKASELQNDITAQLFSASQKTGMDEFFQTLSSRWLQEIHPEPQS